MQACLRLRRAILGVLCVYSCNICIAFRSIRSRLARVWDMKPASNMPSRRQHKGQELPMRGTVAQDRGDERPPSNNKENDRGRKLCERILTEAFRAHAEDKNRAELKEYDRLMKEEKESPNPDSPWILLPGGPLPGLPAVGPFWHNCDTGDNRCLALGNPRSIECKRQRKS